MADDCLSAGEAQETKTHRTNSGSAVVLTDDMNLNSGNDAVADGNDCMEATAVDLKEEISCTACHRTINVNKPGSIHEHPTLKVLICKSCFKWYSSGTIEQGSDGMDEQCRWCGEGGKLVLCDFCNNAFCKDCIRQNLGKKELSLITAEDSKWHCYVCNPEPLKGLVSYCVALQKAVNTCDGGKAAHPSNKTSGTDTDSNCASTSQTKDHHCFFTGKNVDSLTDELYSQTGAWVKKLSTLKSDLKKLNAKSSGGSSANTTRRKEDFAKKIYKHFLSLDEAMVKFKKSARVKMPHVDTKRGTVRPAGKRERKQNGGIEVLDVSFSGNESEGSSSNVLKAIGSLNNEDNSQSSEAKLPSKDAGNAELPDAVNGEAVDGEDVVDGEAVDGEAVDGEAVDGEAVDGEAVDDEMEVEEGQEESKASDGQSLPPAVEESSVMTCSAVEDDGASGNPKIRLTISLPKLSQADLEAQRQLHLEGRNSKSKSDSEDEDNVEEDGNEVVEEEEEEEEVKVKVKVQKKEKDGSASEESDTEEEEEEVNSESSSAEEYNPKHDLRDLKSEQKHERQARARRTKTRAAKKSLQKIREAVQKKKRKAKEEEEEKAEDEKKKKGKKGSKSTPSKKDSEEKGKGRERKSERQKGDKKYKEVDSAEEEEKEDDAEKVKPGKKSKKAKGKGASDAEEADDGDEAKGDAGDGKKGKKGDKKKNAKSGKTKEKDSDGEENEENEDEGKGDEKKDEDKGGKKTKRGTGKKTKKKADADGEEEERCELDDLDEELRRLEKMPQLKADAKSSSAAKKKKKDDVDEEVNEADEQAEETKEKKIGEKKKKKTLVDELEEEGATTEEEKEQEDEEAADTDKEAQDVDEQVNDSVDQLEGEDKDARARKALVALVDDSDEEAGSDNDDSDAEEEEEEEDGDKKKQKKSSGALLIKDSDDEEEEDEDEEEEEEDAGKKHKSKKLLSISLSSSEDEPDKKKKKRGGKKKADDSEDDFVIKKKRGKRKRSDSSSKSDSDLTDDSTEKKKKAKKKRRRIRSNSSSENEESDEDGSDDESTPKGKKRKKIHKILGDKKLSKETLDAAKAEEERRERIAERQKLFNQVVVEDTNSPTKCPVTTKLQLEVDEESKEAVIEVHKKLICKLKPHQVEAVKFMWNCCVESLERLKTEEGSGCILAHCMGLGKTLSVISFVHTMLRNKKRTKMKTCLVLCPLNTILNWESEFENWLSDVSPVDVYELSTVKDNWGRSEIIKDWQEGGGVLIIGYEMFRTLSQLTRVKNKKQKKQFTEGLLDPGPDLVICDEGHILKNDATGLSKACNQIKTKRRVVLTGTPLQNNLIEYHCMVTFVKPKLLGTRKEFSNRFVNPITNGQCSDSTQYDVKIMKRRAHILHETLAGCVQRKDYSALTKYLLPKHEYVVLIRLSKVQVELYEKYLQRLGDDLASQSVRGSRIFTDYQNLMKIWTHPWILKLDEIRQETRKMFKDEYDSFIDDSEYETDASVASKSSKSVEEVKSGSEDEWKPKRVTRGAAKQQKEESTVSKEKEKAKAPNGAKKSQPQPESDEEEVVKGYKTRSRGGGPVDEEPMEIIEDDPDGRVSSEWWADYIKPIDQFNLEISGKLMLLAEILKMAESIGDKVLVFSQSLLSLNLIENFLAHWDKLVASDPDQQVGGTQGWDKGIDYIRMDGSTSAQNRKEWTNMFNDEANVKARLFLISTKAGSLGINLVAANRVIIFDASWNPTHDVQSIFRVYRFGQTKPVYVYRFLAQGTMEEKIYERQVTKQSLAQRVIDEHQIERHFTAADLRELYVFKPDRLDDPNRPERPTPKLPKDRMLAELLTNQKDLIVQYHEHDSLLENKIEEELSEEERKAAWEEYEQEKKGLRPPPQAHQYNMAAAAMIQNMASMYNQPASYQMQSYIPDAHKIAQAIFASNPGISEAELKQRVQYYLQMQLANQQRVMLAQQQKQEMEKLHRMQEERMRQQMLLQQLGFGSGRSENAAGASAKEAAVLSSLLAPPASSSRAASAAPNSKGSGASSASSSSK